MRTWITGTALVALLAAGCSNDSSGESSAAPVEATSAAPTCEEIADAFIAINQEFISSFGAGPYEDWYTDSPSQEMQAAAEVWGEKMAALSEPSVRLGCDDGQLICDRQPQLDPLGPAGEAFIYDNTPCNLEGTFGPDSEAEARLSAWQDSQL